MDITPFIPLDRKIIQSYGDNNIKINDEIFTTNIIVMYDKIINWNIKDINDLTIEDFDIIKNEKIELLIVGRDVKNKSLLKFSPLDIQFMNMGAACRTYNVLIAEGRLAAAALII